jgi:hypothetical protein
MIIGLCFAREVLRYTYFFSMSLLRASLGAPVLPLAFSGEVL